MSDASAPSEFPLEADPARLEPRMLAWWAERGIWARMLEKNAGAEPFVHAGDVLNTVLEDMVVKYRNLSGRRCDFIPSRDSHGPSTLQRLGVFGSWEAPSRPVSWYVHEESAPRTSPSAYVAFRAGPELVERFPSLQGREVFFVTWTAEPWTLPGNVAIAVNGDAEYVFYEAGSRVLCVAKDLLAKVLAEVKADELVMKNARLPGGDVETVAFDDLRKVLVYASGEDLEDLTYQHPFLERTGRVVLGAHVTLEEGTGLVHMAPAHGLEDYEIIQRYGAEVLRLWVAASGFRNDVRLSDESLQELSRGYAKIRGTLHSVLRSLHGFNPARDMVPTAELLPEDSGVRGRLAEVVARVRQAYEAREFHLVYAAVLGFCASLEDRLSTAATAERSRRSAQTVLFEVASALLPLLAPVLSFTAEEAWQQLPGRPAESVFLAALPPAGAMEPTQAER